MKEEGPTRAQILVELGISEAMLYRWQVTYDSMTMSEAKELQRPRDENGHLAQYLACKSATGCTYLHNLSYAYLLVLPYGFS
ncbi:hypothetical protein V3M69_03065 [Trueperella pyogenes]|uniref:Transposase n=1 Tax=Trueperella pyogenes TaxID=1661 RepID=A0A3Q9GLG6_9ACTO|nr:hypothetical protein [Trueperella pyogenes]AZR06521.1 hypothetical protein EBQ10_03935 [Trueperella pyogenes]